MHSTGFISESFLDSREIPSICFPVYVAFCAIPGMSDNSILSNLSILSFIFTTLLPTKINGFEQSLFFKEAFKSNAGFLEMTPLAMPFDASSISFLPLNLTNVPGSKISLDLYNSAKSAQ